MYIFLLLIYFDGVQLVSKKAVRSFTVSWITNFCSIDKAKINHPLREKFFGNFTDIGCAWHVPA